MPETTESLPKRCTAIADQVVPQYRAGTGYACGGTMAKRWQAAWDAAMIALGGDPADYFQAATAARPSAALSGGQPPAGGDTAARTQL